MVGSFRPLFVFDGVLLLECDFDDVFRIVRMPRDLELAPCLQCEVVVVLGNNEASNVAVTVDSSFCSEGKLDAAARI